MALKDWMEGLECVGIVRMTQIWEAAQKEERDSCADICESWGEWGAFGCGVVPLRHPVSECADKIRERSNVEVRGGAQLRRPS